MPRNVNDTDDTCPACNAVPDEPHSVMTEGGKPCNPTNRGAKVASLRAQLAALEPPVQSAPAQSTPAPAPVQSAPAQPTPAPAQSPPPQ